MKVIYSIVAVLTLIWLIIGGLYVCSSWQMISSMEPNEIGDSLAGFFAPLAFLWLIAGYFQQGKELRQNTEALELQYQELKNSVQQQKKMADTATLQHQLASEQFEIFKKSQAELEPVMHVSVVSVNHKGLDHFLMHIQNINPVDIYVSGTLNGEVLPKIEYVKSAHGGQIDPLMVKEGKNTVVLEVVTSQKLKYSYLGEFLYKKGDCLNQLLNLKRINS